MAIGLVSSAALWATRLLCSLAFFVGGCVLANESIHVAAASNFVATLKVLKQDFEEHHPYQLLVSTASTGKIYAQIIHGAPYDVFLAADQHRAELLVDSGRASGSFTYAIGQLAVWHPQMEPNSFNATLLASDTIQRIALANPRIAPYGVAAQQWMMSQGQWSALIKQKIVRGENVAQTLQFVQSGHAQVGFVAFSDMLGLGQVNYTLLAQSTYPEIKQQAVHLNAEQSTLAFIHYLKGARAKEIIMQHGYRLP